MKYLKLMSATKPTLNNMYIGWGGVMTKKQIVGLLIILAMGIPSIAFAKEAAWWTRHKQVCELPEELTHVDWVAQGSPCELYAIAELKEKEKARRKEIRLAAEKIQLAEENAAKQELRLAEEKALKIEMLLAEEKARIKKIRLAEEKARIKKIRLAEEKALKNELRLVKQKAREEERLLAEEKKQIEKNRLAQEKTRIKEIQLAEKKARMEEKLLAQEKVRMEKIRLAREKTLKKEKLLAEEEARMEEIQLAQENARIKETHLAQEEARRKETQLAQQNARIKEIRLAGEKARMDALKPEPSLPIRAVNLGKPRQIAKEAIDSASSTDVVAIRGLLARMVKYNRGLEGTGEVGAEVCEGLGLCDGSANMPLKLSVGESAGAKYYFGVPVAESAPEILIMVETAAVTEVYLTDLTGTLWAGAINDGEPDSNISNKKVNERFAAALAWFMGAAQELTQSR